MVKKNKVVGIITYHAADNYGSVLQAFALNYYLSQEFCVKCDIVNYSSELQRRMYSLYFKNNSIKAILKNIYIFLFLRSKKMAKIHNFSEFRKKYLKMYPSEFTSCIKKLDLNRYDLIVCGSDQIWNVRINDYNPFYILKGIEGPRKVSYAASMGGVNLNLTKTEVQDLYKNLKSFSDISVRENVAKEMLSECLLSNIRIDIDPTFLLTESQWKKIMGPQIIRGEYIFFYSVHYDEESVKIAEWYGDKLNLPIIYLNTSWKSYFIQKGRLKYANTSRVEDFLSLVYYAKAVLSGSFHGTAFSLIFNKPFYRIQRNKNNFAVVDDRIRSLFKMLEIRDREITVDNYKEKIEKLFDMDYQTINKNICIAQQKTKDYFLDIL